MNARSTPCKYCPIFMKKIAVASDAKSHQTQVFDNEDLARKIMMDLPNEAKQALSNTSKSLRYLTYPVLFEKLVKISPGLNGYPKVYSYSPKHNYLDILYMHLSPDSYSSKKNNLNKMSTLHTLLDKVLSIIDSKTLGGRPCDPNEILHPINRLPDTSDFDRLSTLFMVHPKLGKAYANYLVKNKSPIDTWDETMETSVNLLLDGPMGLYKPSYHAHDAVALMAMRIPSLGPAVYDYLSDIQKSNREFFLAAVKLNGWILQCASESWKNDPEIVLAAVKTYQNGLLDASSTLRANPEIVLAAVKYAWRAFRYAAPELKADRKFVQKLVKECGGALKFATNDLQADREIVMTAVKSYGRALKYAADKLKSDREIVLMAVKNDYAEHSTGMGTAFRFSDDKFKADREIVLAAIKYDFNEFFFAADELKADSGFVLEAMKIDPNVFVYAADELKADRGFFQGD